MKIIFFVNCIFITSVLFQSNSAISVEKENIENYKIIIEEISSTLVKKYNVDPKYISKALDSIKIRKKTIESMNNAAERKATWERYRSIFIKKNTIKKGREYHQENYELLKEIEEKYGVPSEVIVAILGVETRYGSGTGNIKVLDSLGTLALMHPRRSKLFKSQLISYLYLTYSNNLDYNNIYGSYAGAMGAPQFMPESYIKFGVDYDGDGKVDLWNSKHDIFASIANYLKEKGWEKDSPIVSEFKIQKKNLKEIFANGDVKTVKVKKNYLNKILANNIDIETTKNYIALLSKKNKKYKIVHKNFKVIMTYNISTFYAMVVTILSEKIAS